MLALGLVLIILAALVVLTVLFGANNTAVDFDLTLFDVQTTPLGVFLVGAATLLVLVTGIGLVQRGTRSQLRHRRDRKELERLHARERGAGGGGGAGSAAEGTPARAAHPDEPGAHRGTAAPVDERRPPV